MDDSELGLLKTALIARMAKEYSWTVGHTGHCLMVLVEITRSEITVLNAVTPKRQQQIERRRSQSQVPELLGLRRKLAMRDSR